MGKGAIANRSYLRRAAAEAASRSMSLYQLSKSYTPSKIIRIEERVEQGLMGLIEEKTELLERSDKVLTSMDQRLDSALDRVEGFVACQKTRAEGVQESLGNSVAFVTSHVSKSFKRTGEEECVDTTELALCERLSCALIELNETYERCLVTADDRIELWLPSAEENAESEKTEVTMTKVTAKAVKKLKVKAFDKLEMAKLRTHEQINTMVTVDLIQYASEQMDAVCGMANETKTKVADKVQDTREYLHARLTGAKEQVEAKLAPHQAACMDKLHTVYIFAEGKWALVSQTAQYATLTAAYKNAVERCTRLRDVSIESVASFRGKTVVLFTDGAVALVDNLREEGYLPEQGKITIQNLAEDFIALCKLSPVKAQELAQTLYSQLVQASKDAPAHLQAKTQELIASCSEKRDVLESMLKAKAAELVALVQSCPKQAQALALKLYSQLLSLKELPYAELILSAKSRWELLHSKLTSIEFKELPYGDKLQALKIGSEKLCKHGGQSVESFKGQVSKCKQLVYTRLYSCAESGFDLVAAQLLRAIRMAPYGSFAWSKFGQALELTPAWSSLPRKVTELFQRDPLVESAEAAEAQQDALFAEGTQLFESCDAAGTGALIRSELMSFAETAQGALLKELIDSKGWDEMWEAIEMEDDETFSKDNFADAYCKLVYFG